jgi:hypothetical protein
MAAKSQFLNQALLNAVLRNVAYSSVATVYAQLNTTTSTPTVPGTADADANLVRVAATFSAPVGSTVSNSGTMSFYGAGRAAGSATIVEVAIYDALTVGNQLYYGSLTASKTVGTGDTASFVAAALTVTES